MFTITASCRPATDLGYLLHKHPDRFQTFKIAYGQASVFYPEASPERCTAVLMLEIDPAALTRRGSRQPQGHALQEYINDRPYSANSHLSVALAAVYATALNGRCDARPELVGQPLPLELNITAVRSRHGAAVFDRLFQPLGWQVAVSTPPLDAAFPEWGESRHHNLRLTSETNTLQQALQHVYVMLPVLDNQKHYWIDRQEVDKLMRVGADWLPQHPERELITRRYLGYRRNLARQANESLDAAMPITEDAPADDDNETDNATAPTPAVDRNRESRLERPMGLQQQRIDAVCAELKQANATSVLDLGCGEGSLLRELIKLPGISRLTGLEASAELLATAGRRLRVKQMTPDQQNRISLLHGSLVYRDQRLVGYDAAVAMEVIEHIAPPRLDAFADAVFGCASPQTVIITTPNQEYNRLFPDWEAGRMRHRDHRFEWTRQEFGQWCAAVGERYGYAVTHQGIGPTDQTLGEPTQMAVFRQQQPDAPPVQTA